MTASPPEPASERTSWAERVATRYTLRLSNDLVDWFDGEVWKRTGSGEFADPVAPEVLLSSKPEMIWPGFMPPDTLPLLGNRYGDWLCLRVGADDRVTEILYWYHGGGDWIPWGATLAEAIAFDRLRHELPGHRQFYAESAENTVRLPTATPLHHWAAEHLPQPVGAAVCAKVPDAPERLADVLLAASVCQVAVRCELALHALDNELRRRLTSEVAHQMQVPWQPDAVRWMFDTRQIPSAVKDQLAQRLKLTPERDFHQDWLAALEHASAVASIRSDLGWPSDLCGWEAEHAGRIDQAVQFYQQALTASSFADQSVRFRTHWFAESKGKFAAARLHTLLETAARGRQAAGDGLSPSNEQYLRRLVETPRQHRAVTVTRFWMDEADAAARESDAAREYEMLYRAGWDLGANSMDTYRMLLERLGDAAARSGQASRAEVARTHLNCLDARFA